MITHYIVLSSGENIASGAPGCAIESVKLTETVNTGTELAPGGVCAAMAEIRLLDIGDKPPLQAGESFTLYQKDGETTSLLGVFTPEMPARKGLHRFEAVAYDNVSKLDKNLDSWLENLTGWPYSLQAFGEMVCTACGLTLKTGQFPNSDYPVGKFTGSGFTGRRLLQYACEIMGVFCRATPTGEIELSWYGDGVVELGSACFENSLQASDYQTAPIGAVQIRRSGNDVGVSYPEGGENAYVVDGNPLLAADGGEGLMSVAESLYNHLKSMVYTPFSAKIPPGKVRAGDRVSLTDSQGNSVTSIVMTKVRQGQQETVSSTGSQSRQCTAAVNSQSYGHLAGKVLNLKTDLEGLRAEHKDAAGSLAALYVTVEGMGAEVSRQQSTGEALLTEVTRLRQSAEGLSLQVEKIKDQGASKVSTSTGYLFDDTGLHIRKHGQEMENRLDHTGMFVHRSGEVILQADAAGVTATDVRVRSYLEVGSHARFEDFEGGTGCFYL